jgi:hypothetical protein
MQRWDVHRYYHHSRTNQFFHLISAISFVVAYVQGSSSGGAKGMAGVNDQPADRTLLFRAKSYDVVNKATHEYKEEVKVGYNLRRKVV